jgi:hypothetical protein
MINTHRGPIKLLLDCIQDDLIKADLINKAGLDGIVDDIAIMLDSIKDQSIKEKLLTANNNHNLKAIIKAAIEHAKKSNIGAYITDPIPAAIINQIKVLLPKMNDQEKFDLLYATRHYKGLPQQQWSAYQSTILYELQVAKNWESQLGAILFEPSIDFSKVTVLDDKAPPADINPPNYLPAEERYLKLQNQVKGYASQENKTLSSADIQAHIETIIKNYTTKTHNKHGRRYRYRERRGAQLRALEYAKNLHTNEGPQHQMAVVAAVYHSLQTESFFGEKMRFLGMSQLQLEIEAVFPGIKNTQQFCNYYVSANSCAKDQDTFIDMLRDTMIIPSNGFNRKRVHKTLVKEADLMLQHFQDVAEQQPVSAKTFRR